ncbi:MAG TPA: RNA methyltransferase [Mesorhizobium sp.]|jgi:tRNA G18 (ribose-2'-O)-methylase SpoU|uniref:TrmH family RNA methyltransferase n=1 Tax=Mesorhizobium sp. TaxID=1871066 RepID=UPI002DDD6262|nr:RNA methyltransferase [Mesorhizobium sp.]HEV2501580.1 RNA methyltransferase [Mesorhizobium sp.]
METIHIDDPEDPRVAPYLDIRERDVVGRQGRFIAEGKVVLNVLLNGSRFRAESVLVLENRLAGLEEVLKKAPVQVPVYVTGREVMDRIAGFPIHRGVLAVGDKGTPLQVDDILRALPQRALIVVAVGIANHDNLGAIFRNAAAFGADAVFTDPTCCDPLYRKAIRVSVGAALKVPFAAAQDPAALAADLMACGFESFALSPSGAADIRGVEPGKKTALYLGTEGEGLPAPLLARMRTLRINMAKGFDSVNVAAASAIALHHFSANDR